MSDSPTPPVFPLPPERRPRLGAALYLPVLREHVDWLLHDQRDLEMQDTEDPNIFDGDWRSLVRETRSYLDGHTGRLGIHGPFSGLPLMTADRKIRVHVTTRLRQALDYGAELGATHCVVHSPFPYFGGPWLPHSPGHRGDAEIGWVHETLDPVVEHATTVGCTLVIEGIYDRNPGPWLALIRSFNSPHVRASVDSGHSFITHGLGGPPPDGWVRAAGDLLAHMHLQDTDGQFDRHWAPGDGRVNFYALFEALSTLPNPNEPRLMIEVKTGLVRRAAAWLAERGLAR